MLFSGVANGTDSTQKDRNFPIPLAYTAGGWWMDQRAQFFTDQTVVTCERWPVFAMV